MVQLKKNYISNQGNDDDTAMNGVKLYCPSKRAWLEGTSMPWGTWSKPQVILTGGGEVNTNSIKAWSSILTLLYRAQHLRGSFALVE